MPHFDALKYITVENIVRKGELACNKQFLLLSQCFLHYMTLIFHFKCTLKMSFAICLNLDQTKILSSGQYRSLQVDTVLQGAVSWQEAV